MGNQIFGSKLTRIIKYGLDLLSFFIQKIKSTTSFSAFSSFS